MVGIFIMTTDIVIYSKKIPLTQEKLAIVSYWWYAFLVQFKWFAWKSTNNEYYVRMNGPTINGKRSTIYMHNFVSHIKRPDHKNRNGLDNTESNLRPSTPSQNGANRRVKNNGHSKYLGVSWNNNNKKWVVAIRKDGKGHCLGSFINENEAGKAYDKKAIEFHGEYANLNFPINFTQVY